MAPPVNATLKEKCFTEWQSSDEFRTPAPPKNFGNRIGIQIWIWSTLKFLPFNFTLEEKWV